MALPSATPARSLSASVSSSPASRQASSAATSANCANGSSRCEEALVEILRWIEDGHFGGDLRQIAGWIEMRDPADAAPALDDPVPERRHADAQRRNGAEAGDRHAPHAGPLRTTRPCRPRARGGPRRPGRRCRIDSRASSGTTIPKSSSNVKRRSAASRESMPSCSNVVAAVMPAGSRCFRFAMMSMTRRSRLSDTAPSY